MRNAWLALQRTQIVSPISGYVSRRSVQPGAQIGTTTPLMAVVPATNLWIDANFKETQLAHMRIGQLTTVISDIYGDDVKYTGKVVGLDMGTKQRLLSAAGAECHQQLDQSGTASAGSYRAG